jgi:hypothetical protein
MSQSQQELSSAPRRVLEYCGTVIVIPLYSTSTYSNTLFFLKNAIVQLVEFLLRSVLVYCIVRSIEFLLRIFVTNCTYLYCNNGTVL